ncbi:hypothetical protein CROQUDRAFT_132946 [Cronartium quercuum f. sp. fusiforme G11]|uniref:Uncharacterized protein n=1 Tax=Cronartium quercuum f. sp. fusiforme G11 TaxID=708437 RepID=A0A9P6NNM2_9BASI|nr:hypothetical protein CROQUDRAFT_132946 [Cronartium quercuum f. sp. fusiforme G11]
MCKDWSKKKLCDVRNLPRELYNLLCVPIGVILHPETKMLKTHHRKHGREHLRYTGTEVRRRVIITRYQILVADCDAFTGEILLFLRNLRTNELDNKCITCHEPLPDVEPVGVEFEKVYRFSQVGCVLLSVKRESSIANLPENQKEGNTASRSTELERSTVIEMVNLSSPQ